ncbi:hypothetical protein RRG08_066555, partial [Elysia crispata]
MNAPHDERQIETFATVNLSFTDCFKLYKHVQTAGSVPTASTCVTVLGLLHVINTMVPVAQAVTRTGLDLPVNMSEETLWLTDKNDSTCNEGENSALKITLKTAIPLSWIRVVLNDTVKKNTIFLNYNVNGANEALECGSTDSTAVVNDRTYDIVCDTQNPVEEFYLFGAGVKSLCSLFISAEPYISNRVRINRAQDRSGGSCWVNRYRSRSAFVAGSMFRRNVALKHQTDQSSTYKTWFSSRAVDGKLGIPDTKTSQRATCSRTKNGNPVWWRLTFSQTVHVFMFHIYNRKDCCKRHLKKFQLTAWGSEGQLLYNYTNQEKKPADVYIVRPNTVIKDVKRVKIHRAHKSGILTLCEIEVFGDVRVSVTVAIKETAVLSTMAIVHLTVLLATLAKTVQNVPREHTDLTAHIPAAQTVKIQRNVVTTLMGHAPTDARAGFEEPNVTLNVRLEATGLVVHASVAHTVQGQTVPVITISVAELFLAGKHCEECSTGFYGEGCNRTCSEHCGGNLKSCHRVNGSCNQGCDLGYMGPLCVQECNMRKWGQNCTEKCSARCNNNNCQLVTGMCNGCVNGYWECNTTTYGKDCGQRCSTNCVEQECHHETGLCKSCNESMIGDFCESARQQEVGLGAVATISVFLGALVVMLVILAVISGIFIWRRWSQRKIEIQENENDIRLRWLLIYQYFVLVISNTIFTSSFDVLFIVNTANNIEESEADSADDAVVIAQTNPVTHTTAVSVEKLKSYIQQHSADSHFQDQFLSIPMTSGSPQTCGVLPENIKKNRYKNIIPYDASRVLLQTVKGKKASDYINASFVKGYKSYKAFIASQGPNDFILTDFVRMLWEQKIEKVVMLTNLVEEGK